MTLQRQWTTSLVTLILLFLSVFAHAEGEYVTYLHSDIQGSPVVATDEQGQVIWRESYAPWGQREIKDTASANPALSSSVWYTGQTEEQSLGLYYYGARWYSPDIAQFYSIDPAPVTLDNPRSFGRYLYANNNPIRYTDPDGRMAVDMVNKRGRFELLTGGPGAFPRGGAIRSIEPSGGGGSLGSRAATAEGAAASRVAPSIERQAADLVSQNGGRNRVTLRSPSQQHEVDLSGKAHNGIPTPHTKVSPRNAQAPERVQPAYNTSDSKSALRPSTQEDIRTVRKYLERQ